MLHVQDMPQYALNQKLIIHTPFLDNYFLNYVSFASMQLYSVIVTAVGVMTL